MHHPTDRITHTTAFVIPVVEHWLEREIAQWVHHEGSIWRPIAPTYIGYIFHSGFQQNLEQLFLICLLEFIHFKCFIYRLIWIICYNTQHSSNHFLFVFNCMDRLSNSDQQIQTYSPSYQVLCTALSNYTFKLLTSSDQFLKHFWESLKYEFDLKTICFFFTT